jgi:hypothetical protein
LDRLEHLGQAVYLVLQVHLGQPVYLVLQVHPDLQVRLD